jgi:hypothetical protein
VGLREDIEAALEQAGSELGVRQLSVDGDEEVWVAGVASVDGALEVRVGDRGPRRGLRRRRPDRGALEALGFRKRYEDAWTLALPPGAGQAARGAAAAVSALRDALGVPVQEARAEVFFGQRGAPDLVAAVEALTSGAEDVAGISTGPAGTLVVTLSPLGGRIRVWAIWPDSEPVDLPGFEPDRDEQASWRDVDRDEAVAAARVVLEAHPEGARRPLFIHLGN